MSEDSSISIEETNKIRLQLGLKPIPIPISNSSTSAANEPAKEVSISIDETNRLRASLGLKPIVIDEPTEVKHVQTTEEYQNEQLAKEKNNKLKENIENLKEKSIRRRNINLSKTLAELDEEDGDDTYDWLSKIKKPVEVNTSVSKPKKSKIKNKVNDDDSTVSGLKVGHSLQEFDNLDGEVILTLKNRSILEEEEDDDEAMIDELESNELLKKEKLQKELREKSKSGRYDSQGNERNLMDRYNEELGNGEDNHFVLSDSIKFESKKPEIESEDVAETVKKGKIKFSLDSEEEEDNFEEKSDYAKAKPIKMKKLNKKTSKGKSSKRQRLDEDGDLKMKSVELVNEDLDIQDGSELQSVLSLKRINNLNKRKRSTAEQLAKEIKEEEENDMNVDENESSTKGLVIDENMEFLSSIKNITPTTVSKSVSKSETIEDNNDIEVKDMDIDTVIQESLEDKSEENDQKEGDKVNFTGGLASTLNFLKSKQIVQEKSSTQINKERELLNIKKEADLNKLRYEISKRIHSESLESNSNLKNLTPKERELFIEKEMEAFKILQNPDDVNDKLQNYKPQISLKYIDELGREMSTKEAYKHLSHQFHGKAPNKSKIEKKKKKFQQERKALKNEKLLE